MINKLDIEKYLALNAQLQKKKNALRKALKEKGIIKKDKENTFDKYAYLSEAAYKNLFTELFANFGLELKTSEISYEFFDGSEKQPNGRTVKLQFTLFDIDTGFYEEAVITGEGLDKGDKAGYKAATGALKYYLASNFMVATGDDAENDTPETTRPTKKAAQPMPQKGVQGFQSNFRAASAFCEENGMSLDNLLGIANKLYPAKQKINDLTKEEFSVVISNAKNSISGHKEELPY